MEQVNKCDLCNSKQYKPFLTFHEYGEDFYLVSCTNCGLLFVNPRPTPLEIGKYYPDDYSPYNENSFMRLVNHVVFSFDAKKLKKYINPRSLVLEIGCASGNYLAYLRDHFGCKVFGVEYSEYATKLAKKRGLKVKQGLLDEVDLEENFYDFIIMRHVLEHVHSPQKTLEKISNALKPGGHFICTVPNADNIEIKFFGTKWSNWDIPRHLFHYTKKSLKNYCDNNQLELVDVSYGKVPNDYIKSTARYLPKSFSKFFNIYNPLLIIGYLPVSVLFGSTGKSGRITVTAKKLKSPS